jgi:hypothetical protein
MGREKGAHSETCADAVRSLFSTCCRSFFYVFFFGFLCYFSFVFRLLFFAVILTPVQQHWQVSGAVETRHSLTARLSAAYFPYLFCFLLFSPASAVIPFLY